jgi:hypothetical protein
MPIQTIMVEPELFLEHNGVKVFYTYKHDEIEQGTNMYYFTLQAGCGVEECICEREPCLYGFDVRELPSWNEPAKPNSGSQDENVAWQQYWAALRTAIESAMIAAINQQQLTTSGLQGDLLLKVAVFSPGQSQPAPQSD